MKLVLRSRSRSLVTVAGVAGTNGALFGLRGLMPLQAAAVFLAYGVRDAGEGAGVQVGDLRGGTLAVVVGGTRGLPGGGRG